MGGPPGAWRLMRTFSSPSVISISPIPDSWTRSISFFSLRRSMGGAYFFAHTSAHIQQRFDIWLDPFHDPGGSGYQISQSIFAQADEGMRWFGQNEGKSDDAGNFQLDGLRAGNFRVIAQRGWGDALRTGTGSDTSFTSCSDSVRGTCATCV